MSLKIQSTTITANGTADLNLGVSNFTNALIISSGTNTIEFNTRSDFNSTVMAYKDIIASTIYISNDGGTTRGRVYDSIYNPPPAPTSITNLTIDGTINANNTTNVYTINATETAIIGKTLYVGDQSGSNPGAIYFGGVSGDTTYDNCIIESREYSTINGNKLSELLLFKGSEVSTIDGGPDRIRLRAANIVLDTYNVSTLDRSTTNTRVLIDANGNVGIGTITPQQLLDVSGNARIAETQFIMGKTIINQIFSSTLYSTSTTSSIYNNTISTTLYTNSITDVGNQTSTLSSFRTTLQIPNTVSSIQFEIMGAGGYISSSGTQFISSPNNTTIFGATGAYATGAYMSGYINAIPYRGSTLTIQTGYGVYGSGGDKIPTSATFITIMGNGLLAIAGSGGASYVDNGAIIYGGNAGATFNSTFGYSTIAYGGNGLVFAPTLSTAGWGNASSIYGRGGINRVLTQFDINDSVAFGGIISVYEGGFGGFYSAGVNYNKAGGSGYFGGSGAHGSGGGGSSYYYNSTVTLISSYTGNTIPSSTLSGYGRAGQPGYAKITLIHAITSTIASTFNSTIYQPLIITSSIFSTVNSATIGKTLYVGDETGTNPGAIYFGGVGGDITYDNCIIESREYSTINGNKLSELLLFKGNEVLTSDGGPDRIRLRAANIVLDTYNVSTLDRSTTNTRLIVDANGNVGIGTSNPTSKLSVNGTIGVNSQATNQNSINFYRSDNIITENYREFGYIGFFGYGGDGNPTSSGNNRGAFIISNQDGDIVNNKVPGNLSFYTRSTSATDTTERMRITSDGSIFMNNNKVLHVDFNGASFRTEKQGLNSTIIQNTAGPLLLGGNPSPNGFGLVTLNDTNMYVNGKVGIGTTSINSGMLLDVSGAAVIRDTLYLGIGDSQNSRNGSIIFNGSYGDYGVNSCVIEQRLYVPGSTGNSELLLFKGNNGVGGADGIDRIRLKAGEIRFDTFTGNLIAEGGSALIINDTDRSTVTTNMIIDSNGNVGIGTTSPSYKLHVTGTSYFSGFAAIENGLDIWSSGGNSNSINFKKIDTQTTTDNNELGYIGFHGRVGTVNDRAGFIICKQDGTVTNGNVPGKLQFYVNNTSGIEVVPLTIKASGNVGIGVENPTSKLHVIGNTTITDTLTIQSTTGTGFINVFSDGASKEYGNIYMNGYIKIFGKGQNSVVYNQLSSDSGGISFFNTGGNVGIGTTTPGYKLHVIGNTTITDVLLVQSTTGTGFIKLNATTFGTYGNIDMNGNFTMYKNGQNATISNYFSCELNGNSFFNTGGSVAIGTDQSNGYKLNVNGNIKCTEVIADNGSNYAIRDDISTSGNTSLTANDKNKLLVITPTVNITLTLPATNVVGKGAFYKIANRATAYTITINNSSNTAQLVLYPSQVGEIIALDSTSTGTWFVAAP